MRIILATTSPYRKKAMELTGIPFETRASNIDEYFEGRPDDPAELVKALSILKAEAAAKDCTDSLVFGFDSVGCCYGKILEKPKSEEEAFERLRMLSGNQHEFYTGVCMINTKTEKRRKALRITEVEFRALSDEEIRAYLKEDPDYNTYALGYDPLDSRCIGFIKRIEGDPNNLLRGIPLAKVVEMIGEEQDE